MTREVFISYSSVNFKEAQRVGKALSLMGVSNWLAPNQLIYGTEYSGQITQAIREATILIVLISRDSMKSHQVLNEIALATEFKKEIIAYRLDDEPLNDSFKYYLVARHWINAGTDGITALTKLAHLVNKLRNERSAAPKSPEVIKAEQETTEILFIFIRFGVIILTVIGWLITMFLLHNYAYGTQLYIIGMIIADVVEILLIIAIAGPIFGGAGKFAGTVFKKICEAFKGE